MGFTIFFADHKRRQEVYAIDGFLFFIISDFAMHHEAKNEVPCPELTVNEIFSTECRGAVVWWCTPAFRFIAQGIQDYTDSAR